MVLTDLNSSPPGDQEKGHVNNPPAGFSVQVNKRKKMLQVQKNKKSLKIDDELVLSNVYMKHQIDGHGLHKLVSRRKMVPNKSLSMWKYNMMRQKDSVFSEHLIQGMCTELHNTYLCEIPRTSDRKAEAMLDLNMMPEEANEQEKQQANGQEQRQANGQEQRQANGQEQRQANEQRQAILDLNMMPEEANEQEQWQANEQEQRQANEQEKQQANEQEQRQANGQEQRQANEQRQAILDMNMMPEEANEEGMLEEAIGDQVQEEAVKRHAINLTDKQRYAAYFALAVIEKKEGKVHKTDKELVASLLKTSLSTVDRIWKDANEKIAKKLPVDVSSRKKGRVGRKRKELHLSRILTIPLNKRKTIRALSRSLGVCRSTLHRSFKLGEVKRHTSTLKPAMTEANKISRLKFCVSMLNEHFLTTPGPIFQEMDNIIHIDEKWFDMTREKNTYYLLHEESAPVRTVRNKNSIGKVLFLTAVAKPRYGEGGVVTFDGKIGTWAFVHETPALKKSKNRDRGTMELKSLKVTRDVMRRYMCDKLIPAIAEVWPDEDEDGERTIYIQQDNAKPHVLPRDKVFRQAVAKTGLDIRLIQQPPNSPDLNVLDLCFFRSLQSLTETRAPTTIKELIDGVQEEYQNYEVDKLSRSFLTLQSVMIEVMKEKGGIGYDLKHMQKERRLLEGVLPVALSIPIELLDQTIDLIAEGEEHMMLEQGEVQKLEQQGEVHC